MNEGKYYLVGKINSSEISLLRIISITPGGRYYVECNGKRFWSFIYKEWNQYLAEGSFYIIEELPDEYVKQLFREDKLKRIVNKKF